MQMNYFSVSLVLVLLLTQLKMFAKQVGKYQLLLTTSSAAVVLVVVQLVLSFTYRARRILLLVFEFNVYCIITAVTKVTVSAVVLVVFIHQLMVGGML